MIIDIVSDLHGYQPELPGGDLLLLCGDYTAQSSEKEFLEFIAWLRKQPYEEKIFIAGNHDTFIEAPRHGRLFGNGIIHLSDWGTTFNGLKIWGSPWTKTFPNMNPHCMAFTVDTDDELKEKWDLIPEDTDILITHSPPFSILDTVKRLNWNRRSRVKEVHVEHVGSHSLYEKFYGERLKCKLHAFGHIHGAYGVMEGMLDCPNTTFVNASYVDEEYDPVHQPVRIEL